MVDEKTENNDVTDALLKELENDAKISSNDVNRDEQSEPQPQEKQGKKQKETFGQYASQDEQGGFDFALIDGEFLVDIFASFGAQGVSRIGQWAGDKELTVGKAQLTAKERKILITLVDKKLSEMNPINMSTNEAIFYSVVTIYGSRLLPSLFIMLERWLTNSTETKEKKEAKRGRPVKEKKGEYIPFQEEKEFHNMTKEEQEIWIKKQ
jgi:hypothetical protein